MTVRLNFWMVAARTMKWNGCPGLVWIGTLGIALLVSAGLAPGVRSQGTTTETIRWNVKVEGVSSDGLALDIKGGTIGPEGNHESKGAFDHVEVKDAALKERVKKLRKNDQITLIYGTSAATKELKDFSWTLLSCRQGRQLSSCCWLPAFAFCSIGFSPDSILQI
jgi:hypothetical protein